MYDAIGFYKKLQKNEECIMNDNNLLSIGEIAKTVGITRRIILNYEAKGLIVPDKKEGAAGNRYYTIDTFTQIRTIRIFQNLGLSLDEIKAYFDSKTDLLPLIRRLEKLRDEINLNIERLYERSNRGIGVVTEKEVALQTVYCKTVRTATIAERAVILRETAIEAMRNYSTDTARRMYFTEYPLDDTDEITYAVAISPESHGKNIAVSGGFKALCAYHHGAYEDIPKTREMILRYAAEHGITVMGKCRHVYLEGPPQHKDKSQFITQIIIPVCD